MSDGHTDEVPGDADNEKLFSDSDEDMGDADSSHKSTPNDSTPSGALSKEKSGKSAVSSKHNHIRYESSADTDAIIRHQHRLHKKLRKACMHGHAGPRLDKPLGGRRAAAVARTHNTQWRFPLSLPRSGPGYGVSDSWHRVADLLRRKVPEQEVELACQVAAEKANTLEARKDAAEAQRRQADEAIRRKDQELSSMQQQLAVLAQERDTAVTQLSTITKERDDAVADAAAFASKSFVSALAKPNLFTGNRTTDKQNVKEWLASVHDYLFSSQIAKTDIQKVQFAEGRLQAEARRAWTVQKSVLHAPTADNTSPYAGITFADFEKHMLDKWNPTCTAVKARYDMDALRQDNMSIQTFVTKFDDLCTYLPNMDEEDKIHKFLTKLSDAYADIAIDPATRQRWTSYQMLKDYAITFAATKASRPALRKRIQYPGALGEAAVVAQGALKKQRTSDGWQRVGPKRRHGDVTNKNGASSSQSAQRQRHSNPAFRTFTNKNGEEFSRHQALVDWCHGSSICLCCYAAYTAATAGNHRENCPAHPARGFPQGYNYTPKSQRQQ